MKVHFKLISGQEIKHEISKPLFTIGRSNKCDLSLPYDGFSRIHCQIEVTPEGDLFITDLGSVNGIFIDGVKIEPHRRIPYNSLLPLDIGPAEVTILQEDLSQRRSPIAQKTPEFITVPPASSQPKKLHRPSPQETPKKFLKNLKFIFIIAIAFLAYKEIKKMGTENGSEDEELSRLQFEQMKRNQRSDGSIQTKDF